MRRLGIVILFALAARAASAADDGAGGRKLYVAKCARCHKFYDPSAYDDAKWNQWMDKMRRKARLGDEQYATLSQYLETLRPTQRGQSKVENGK